MFTITESAQKYLLGLLEKQDDDVIGVRLYVNTPGTPKAETCIAYCRVADRKDDDLVSEYEGFTCYVERRSLPFLEEALVDFSEDRMGGQLTIKAPNAKMPKVNEDSPLEDRVNYVLQTEVNPQLASHGGECSLEEITDDGYVVLKFGGGCQGCSQVDVTVKQGVEKTLIERIPGLKGVKDATDHSDRSQAYI
ncbi:MAG TPA: Fe-S biogenesis protein NfuA [Pseudomonadales bacterium]|jgi:Fe/S biogenesis protein NfuA